jgi:hypothetical protein
MNEFITYEVVNPITGKKEAWSTQEFVDAKQLAQTRLSVIRSEYLLQEAIRFHLVKVTQNAAGEVWAEVNPEEETEELGDYKVFKQYEGTYDSFNTLTHAKTDIEIKQNAFLTELGLDKVNEIVEIVENVTDTPAATGMEEF